MCNKAVNRFSWPAWHQDSKSLQVLTVYQRSLRNGRNRKKTIFQPVHHKQPLFSEQAGSSAFSAIFFHWGNRPHTQQQEFPRCWSTGIFLRTSWATRKCRALLLSLLSLLQSNVTDCASHTVPLRWEGLLLIKSSLTCKNSYYYFVGCFQGGKWHQEQMVRG